MLGYYLACSTSYMSLCGHLGRRRERAMLSAVAVRAGELLAAVAFAGAVLLAAATAGVWWLQRRLRHGLDSASRAVAGRASRAAAGGIRAGGRWLWSRPVPDRHWVTAAVSRHRLWRSVAAAEHAVAQAGKSGAPTGDLEGLCRRLRRAAVDADRSLALAGRATPSPSSPHHDSSHAAELVAAARLIQDAAASSAASLARPAVATLTNDVRQEVVALSAGLASAAHSARPSAVPAEPT
jgi:hypothetical protein